VEVARLVRPARLAALVEDVVAAVVDGPAVRDAAPGRVDLVHHEVVGPDRGLGRAAEADQSRAREGGAQFGRQRQRRVVAAEEDQAQVPGAGVARLGEQRRELVQRGRRRVPERDALGQQHVQQQLGIALLRGVGDVQRGAVPEQAEDVEHGQVEAERGDAQAEIGRAEGENAFAPREQVVQRAMPDHDALRGTGAARGVDNVSDVVRPGDGRRVVIGFVAVRPLGLLHTQHRDVGREPPVHRAVRGEYRRRAGLGEQAERAPLGQVRFDGQVCAAGLEDPVDGGHHLWAAPGADRHHVARADPDVLEAPGDPVRGPVQLPDGHGAAAPPQRCRVGPDPGLLLEPQVHRTVHSVRTRGVVPFVDEPPFVVDT
jgi:hypothetical protein